MGDLHWRPGMPTTLIPDPGTTITLDNLNALWRRLSPRSWAQAAPLSKESAAYMLAQRILGADVCNKLGAGTYRVTSKLCPVVVYDCSTIGVSICKRERERGSLCLTRNDWSWALWDGVLARTLILQHDELRFLKTANYALPYRTPARPMTRRQFASIFGKSLLPAWDTYTI